MSNNNSTELLAWTREVRALHTELARPIESDDDPRMKKAKKADPRLGMIFPQINPKERGSLYFDKFAPALIPAPPIEAPTWAESHEFYLDDCPSTVGVEFLGPQWATGDGLQWARLSAHYIVAIDGYDDDDKPRVPGDMWGGEVLVDFRYPEPFRADGTPNLTRGYMTLEGAFQLEIALGDALNVLRPSFTGEEFLASLDDLGEVSR